MMGRLGIWIAALWGAFFLGRRAGESEGPPDSVGAAAPRRSKWLEALGLLASVLEMWARLAPRPASPRRVEGRLGGEASSAGATLTIGEEGIPLGAGMASVARPTPRGAGAAARKDATQGDAAPGELPASGPARWWAIVRELFRRFGEDQAPAFAASLAFFGILSLVPVLLVALAALGYLIHDPQEAAAQLERIVQQMLPGGQAKRAAATLMKDAQIAQQAEELMKARGIAGVIGIVSLVWASLQIFVNGATSMNAAWSEEESRPWIKLRLVALGLLVGAGGLFLLSLLPSSGPDAVRRLNIPWLGLPEQVPWYIDLAFTLLAVAINVVMFALIYRFLPNAQVTWRQAFVGGAFMGVLWELAKQGFSLYLSRFDNYNKMYGSLGGLIILILWIYYTSMLLLLGAEVAKLYKDVREGKLRRDEAKPPADPAPKAEPA